MQRSLILGGLVVVILAAIAVVAIADSGGGGLYGSSTRQATTAEPAADASVAVADHGAGPILVDGSGRTLYVWQADTGTQSTCTGACAQASPRLATTASVRAGSGVNARLLGLSKRAGGSRQVTYAGHPLYRFAGDTAPGERNGQGSSAFGAAWRVVAPTGAAITQAG